MSAIDVRLEPTNFVVFHPEQDAVLSLSLSKVRSEHEIDRLQSDIDVVSIAYICGARLPSLPSRLSSTHSLTRK